MASSSYWRAKREDERRKINKYADWLWDLRKIRDGFSEWGVQYGPSTVNAKLRKAVANLNDAVDGCSTFNSNVNDIEAQTEPDTKVDYYVWGAETAVNREIARVEDLKRDAEDNYDYYDRMYDRAREAERAAAEAARKAKEAAESASS